MGDPFFRVPRQTLFHHRSSKPVGVGSPAGYYVFMSYVRYKCEFCDLEVIPTASGTMRLVLAWVRPNNSGITGVQQQHKYAHAICVETQSKRGKKEGASGELLF